MIIIVHLTNIYSNLFIKKTEYKILFNYNTNFYLLTASFNADPALNVTAFLAAI